MFKKNVLCDIFVRAKCLKFYYLKFHTCDIIDLVHEQVSLNKKKIREGIAHSPSTVNSLWSNCAVIEVMFKFMFKFSCILRPTFHGLAKSGNKKVLASG